MDHMIAGFQLKSMDDKTGAFEGYGSTFGNVDEGRDAVQKGAFTNTIKEHGAAGTMPHMLFSHDTHEPIGEWGSWEQDDKGLYMKGQLWLGSGIEKAAQAHLMLKSKGPKGLSIGYGIRPGGASYDKQANVRNLIDLDVGEVSPTPFPMNRKAVIVSVKSLRETQHTFKMADGSFVTKREMEELLRDACGLSASEAKAFLADGFSGLVPAQRDAGAKELLDLINNHGSATRA